MRPLIALLLLCAAPAWAEEAPLIAERWELALVAQFVTHDGRQAVRLGNPPDQPLRTGMATLRDSRFETGVIEFDLWLGGNRDFAGFIFRDQGDGNAEYFYVRPHQNGNPDTMQYTPVINGMTSWQIYSQYNARTRLPINEWFHVRMEIAADSARMFVGSDDPILVVGDLKRDRAAGYVMLRGSLGVGLQAGEAAPLPLQGVAANLRFARIDVDAWERVFSEASGVDVRSTSAGTTAPTAQAASLNYLPTVLAVRAGQVDVDGRSFNNVVLGGSREGTQWRANVDADDRLIPRNGSRIPVLRKPIDLTTLQEALQ